MPSGICHSTPELMPTALACAAKIVFPEENDCSLFTDMPERKKILSFYSTKLFPSDPEQGEVSEVARLKGLELIQAYRFAAGKHTALPLLTDKSDSSVHCHSWVNILLKIIKLDGRYPQLGVHTAEQLAAAEAQEESEEAAAFRYSFLIATANTLLHRAYYPNLAHIPVSRSGARQVFGSGA